MNTRRQSSVTWRSTPCLAAALLLASTPLASAQVVNLPIRETVDTGPSLGPGGRPHSGMGSVPSIQSDAGARSPFAAYFLPALLPVLGVEIPVPSSALAPSYPREAAGEPFFMAYGNLAAQNRLPDPRADQLAGYRTARLTLLTELRVELDRGPEVDADTRTRALAGLAAAQTPRLLELEAEAEQIRHALTHPAPFKPIASDIGNLVPVEENPAFKDTLADIRMLLSAAHFRAGLSLVQRQLLEEMAQERRLRIEPEPIGVPPANFFWPAGARIAVPDGLSREAAARFDDFQRRKTALKAELLALLESDRRQIFNHDNTPAFERLSAAQAPRFAELDILADELRPALAALTPAGPAATPEIPTDLAPQIISLAERTAALQADLRNRLAEFRAHLRDDRLELVQQGNAFVIAVTTHGDSPSHRDLVLAHIREFNEEVSARFAALAVVREQVRAAIASHQARSPDSTRGQTPDQFAATVLGHYRHREYLNRQRDYTAAVLTSGLSPAQRRLLLAAATVESLH